MDDFWKKAENNFVRAQRLVPWGQPITVETRAPFVALLDWAEKATFGNGRPVDRSSLREIIERGG